MAQLTAPQVAFLLMPLRHGGDGAGARATPAALYRCRDLVATRQAVLAEEAQVLERFARATVRQIRGVK